jgi:tetratricopeptide (TPR) repeat protein
MPKLRKYILAALLTATACAAVAQTPAPRKTDTVYDTVWDTVHDTVQGMHVGADTDDRYYRLAEKAIDHRMTTITVILSIIGLLLASFSVALVVEGRRAARKIEQELESARKDVANAILTAQKETLEARRIIEGDLDELKIATKAELEKVRSETDTSVRDIRRLTGEAQQHILDAKEQAKRDLEGIAEARKNADQQAAELKTRIAELDRMTEKPIREAEQKAAGAPGINFEEKLKFIESADAEEAIKQYELLIADMKKGGVPQTKIPSSLHRNIGLNYYRLKRYEKAVSELLEYLKDAPNDEYSLFVVAYAYHELRDYETAAKYYERLTVVNPAHAIAFNNWGTALYKLYDVTKEIKWLDLACQKYEQAIIIKADFYEAFYGWGFALLTLHAVTKDKKHFDDAIVKIEESLKFDPQYAPARLSLAEVHGYAGDRERMIEPLKKAISLDAKQKKLARESKFLKAFRDDPEFIALTKEDGGEQTG